MTEKTAGRGERSNRPQRISGPVELLQAVPYLLGFHPLRSLVLVGLADGMLVVTARLDLADAVGAGMLDDTVGALARGGTDEVLAVAYPDSAGDPDGWAGVVALVQSAADRYALDCGDVLLVVDGRWRSLLCTAEHCCPPDGRPLGREVSAFAAAATVAGVVPLRDRHALEETLAPLSDVARGVLVPPLDKAALAAQRAAAEGNESRHIRAIKRRMFAAARTEAEAGTVNDAAAAEFGQALRTTEIRNAVWMAIDDGRLDGRPLWRDLARRLPSPYDAVPLFLYGWTAWRAGNGALASVAAALAIESDPDCTPALLLSTALEHAVDPRRLPRLRNGRPARTA